MPFQYLRFERDLLESLDKYIAKNFSKLLTFGPDSFCRLNEGIEECVIKEREVPRLTSAAPKITATITITNADITTTQRFLWDLNRYGMLENFNFRTGTENSDSPKSEIRLNKVDAHLAIVKSALKFLEQEPNAATKAIGPYLLSELPKHLKVLFEATELDAIGAEDKRAIGKGIYNLFDDVTIIQKHWESCDRITWYKETESISIFLKWLDDKTAISELSRKDKVWLREVQTAKSPSRALLNLVTTMIAKHWLLTREWETSYPFSWIQGFLTLVSTLSSSDACACS
jgi:hypothetical protein